MDFPEEGVVFLVDDVGVGVVLPGVGVVLPGVGVVLPVATDEVRGGGVGTGDVTPSFLAEDAAVGDINPPLPLDAREDADDGRDPVGLCVSDGLPDRLGLFLLGSLSDCVLVNPDVGVGVVALDLGVDDGTRGVVGREIGFGVEEREVDVLPTPSDERLGVVLLETLLLVSDEAEVILEFEVVLLLFRFDVLDGVVLFRLFVSAVPVLFLSVFFELLVVPCI